MGDLSSKDLVTPQVGRACVDVITGMMGIVPSIDPSSGQYKYIRNIHIYQPVVYPLISVSVISLDMQIDEALGKFVRVYVTMPCHDETDSLPFPSVLLPPTA